MDEFKKFKDDARQTDAEVDSLRLLWSRTIRTFTPDKRQFAAWLRLAGYAETTRAINDTIRLHIKYEATRPLAPGQMIRFMEQCISKAMLLAKAATR
jgi:hypothetical protein